MTSMTTRASITTEGHGFQSQLYDRVELLPGKLDFALVSSAAPVPASDNKAMMESGLSREKLSGKDDHGDEELICMDGDLIYARFFADFGPLHLARTASFCRELETRLCFPTATNCLSPTRRLVMYCGDHPHKRANAMTLLAIFLVIVWGFTPEQAVSRVLGGGKPPFGFRDASCGVCSFFITLLDCARAVRKALDTSVWSYQTFSPDEYDALDRLENGDMNWIVPRKLLAFSGPQRERIVLDDSTGATTLLARDYAARFRDMGVTCVIRFNEPNTYDRKAFIHAGLRHIDLPFPDGSNPSDEVLSKFIRTCERESGAVAVHCKAGLGRTGTAIAAYLMKNYRFSATEAIAWCRICRPGSIVGPQQHFLAVKQPELHALPSIFAVQPVNRPPQSAARQPKRTTPHKLNHLPLRPRHLPISR